MRGVGAGRSAQRGTSGATTGPRGAAGPHNPDYNAANELLPPVSFLGPRIAAHVVAVLLPEARAIAVHELQAADPLGALPEVQVRHEQTQRPAVLGRDRFAVAGVDE